MLEQLRQQLMRLAHARTHAFIPHPYPHRQSIDEHPQHAVGALAALHPAKHHGAEHHIVTPGYPSEHHCASQMADTGCRYTQRSRLGTQAPVKLRIYLAGGLNDLAAVSLHIGQPKRSRRLIYIPQQLRKESLMLLAAHSQTRLRHEVTEG